MARITSPAELLYRVIKMLPPGIPINAIQDVECDPTDGTNGGGSYWVYLSNGFECPSMGCQTIHEDTLKDLRPKIREIVKSGTADTDIVSYSVFNADGITGTGEMTLLGLNQLISDYGKEAKALLESRGADHVMYAAKFFDTSGRKIEHISLYQGLTLGDTFYDEVVGALKNCQVYAVHKRTP